MTQFTFVLPSQEGTEGKYNNRLLCAGRTPAAFIVSPGGDVVPFRGSHIPGLMAIRERKYTKEGKWSHTVFKFKLAPGVGFVSYYADMHNMCFEEYGAWEQVHARIVNGLGILVDAQELRRVLIEQKPRSGEDMDEREEALESLGVDDAEDIKEYSFGCPTNRQIDAGWWSSPKSCGDIVFSLVDQKGRWKKENITCEGGTVIDVHRTPGMHRGYRTIRYIPQEKEVIK